MVRGYTPALVGLPQTTLSEVIVSSHDEQVARKPLNLFHRPKNPKVPASSHYSKNDEVYIYSSKELSSAYGRRH